MHSPEINPDQEKARVRQTDAYKRLKTRFADGDLDVKTGLEFDVLTVGDLADVSLVFFECMPKYPSYLACQNLADAARVAARNAILSPKLEVEIEIETEIDQLMHTRDLAQITRGVNPLYDLKVNLIEMPLRYFEVIHNPTVGFIRVPNLYWLVLTKTSPGDYLEPFVTTIFEETGLPVQSSIREK
jgi:hypothetical protein